MVNPAMKMSVDRRRRNCVEKKSKTIMVFALAVERATISTGYGQVTRHVNGVLYANTVATIRKFKEEHNFFYRLLLSDTTEG